MAHDKVEEKTTATDDHAKVDTHAKDSAGHGENDQKDSHVNLGHEDVTKVETLDLSGVLTPGVVATCLAGLANERGEVGKLAFEISVKGKIPVVGPLKAVLEALGELEFLYTMNDQGMYNMAVEWKLAGGVGLEIGGGKAKASAGVTIGFGGDFANMSFSSPDDAAKYLLYQLDKLVNHTDAGPILQIVGAGTHAPHPAYSSHDHDTFVSGKAGAVLGNVEGEISHTLMKRDTDLHVHDEEGDKEYQVHRDFETTAAKLKYKMPGESKAYDVEYEREWSDTTGSPVFYNNGVFVEHNLEFGLPKTMRAARKASGETAITAFKSAILGTIAGAGLALPNLNLVEKAFLTVGTALLTLPDKIEAKGKMQPSLRFRINWNNYGEADGTQNNMYIRTYVVPTFIAEAEVEAGVVEVEVEAEASKSELISEHIGSNTVSYIQRQWQFGRENGHWNEFKGKNQEQMYELTEHMATEGHAYYQKSVEEAFRGSDGQGKDYKAGFAAVERFWEGQNKDIAEVRSELTGVSAAFRKAKGFFWTDEGQEEAAAEPSNLFLDMLDKVKEAPAKHRFIIDMAPGFNINMERFSLMAAQSKNKYRWNRHMRQALKNKSNAAVISTYYQKFGIFNDKWVKG